MLSNMRDSSRHHVQGVPVTIVIEPENECFPDSSSDEEEEEEEAREDEEAIEASTSSSICSGVYFNNTEIHVSTVPHPLQSRPALIGEPQGLNVPNGRPLPCPPKLVILGGRIEPLHCEVRSASHCDYRKLTSPTPECRAPPCKRPKFDGDSDCQQGQTAEWFASRMIDRRHTILSEEQQMFVEAAAALKVASNSKPVESSWHASRGTGAPLRITTPAGALPPPPYRLPEPVILKLLSKPQP